VITFLRKLDKREKSERNLREKFLQTPQVSEEKEG